MGRVCAGLLLTPLMASATQSLDSSDLPGEWKTLVENLRERIPLRAIFLETRKLPFRKDPIVLTGILRLDAERGLSLCHPDAEGSPITVIDSNGMAMRSNQSDWQALPDRRSIRSVHTAIAALLVLDLRLLSEDFELIGELDRDNWQIQLSPKPGADTGRLRGLSIAGTPERVNRLGIDLGGNRSIVIKISSEESVPGFGPEEYARFFR
ncbi:MAG: hypothetical protein DRP71_08695 [Verrucomicrobia bacterium]|nr:MAG: hypothetical protein DRP71_08695 [Verrucomicrobiota bacterium]